MKVTVYPPTVPLFKDKEELGGEALQMGSVQMLAPSISKFGPFGVKEFEVFDLPFVTPRSGLVPAGYRQRVWATVAQKLDVRGCAGPWRIGTLAFA